MVELMLGVLFSVGLDCTVETGEVSSCCDIEDEGSISPVTLMSVVGEMGAGVLNSNAW